MRFIKVKQHFARPRIPDQEIEDRVQMQMIRSGVAIPRGASIAIAVGSRGIANLPRIVQTVVRYVQDSGGQPFIVPAMGSHGGATAEGQCAVLASYGISETAIGAPIRSAMDVVELPPGDLQHKVYMDRLAYQADGTILINRVKPHTDYHGLLESGLLKMCVIGLGKHQGALEIHQYGTRGLRELIPPTARQVLTHGKILLGIALAENAYDETAIINAWRPEAIESEERQLLQWARANMPSLPVRQLDVLIVEEFGKDISGVGIDPNIIGRLKIKTDPEPDFPKITSIMLLELTEKSHGNAIGMGLADIITRRFFDKIDFRVTYENVVTSSFFERGFTPIVVEDEHQGLEYALRAYGLADPHHPRVIRIKNTLRLDELWVSPAVLEEIQGREQIEVTGETMELV